MILLDMPPLSKIEEARRAQRAREVRILTADLTFWERLRIVFRRRQTRAAVLNAAMREFDAVQKSQYS